MNHVKILIIDENGDGESVWAKPLDDSIFEIDNVPFFSYNISNRDIVRAEQVDGMLHLIKVVSKGGHRTLWLNFDDAGGLAGELCNTLRAYLRELGCSCEGFRPILLAVDVPPEVPIEPIIKRLESESLEWDFGDPHPTILNPYRFEHH